jgi:hypothetical protein
MDVQSGTFIKNDKTMTGTHENDLFFPMSPEREYYPTGATPKQSPIFTRYATSAGGLGSSTNRPMAELERANRAMVQEVRVLKQGMMDRLGKVESDVEAAYIMGHKNIHHANDSLNNLARITLPQTLEIAQLKQELKETKNELAEMKQRLVVLEEALTRKKTPPPPLNESSMDRESQFSQNYSGDDDVPMQGHDGEIGIDEYLYSVTSDATNSNPLKIMLMRLRCLNQLFYHLSSPSHFPMIPEVSQIQRLMTNRAWKT